MKPQQLLLLLLHLFTVNSFLSRTCYGSEIFKEACVPEPRNEDLSAHVNVICRIETPTSVLPGILVDKNKLVIRQLLDNISRVCCVYPAGFDRVCEKPLHITNGSEYTMITLPKERDVPELFRGNILEVNKCLAIGLDHPNYRATIQKSDNEDHWVECQCAEVDCVNGDALICDGKLAGMIAEIDSDMKAAIFKRRPSDDDIVGDGIGYKHRFSKSSDKSHVNQCDKHDDMWVKLNKANILEIYRTILPLLFGVVLFIF